MRLPWFSQRQSPRGATRRKRAAPLKVRRLERRRVLDAAVTDLVFAPADLDPSTAAHDVGEGTPITVSSDATGTGTLVYDWTLTQNGNTVAQGNDPTFHFTPLDDAQYSLSLTVTDQGGEGTSASRSENVVVRNVRPTLILALDQQVEEGQTLNLVAPQLGLFVDPGVLDTHTATINWGDGSPLELADKSPNPPATALGGTHTYFEEGQYKVTVSVTDDDGGIDTKSFFVTVVNANPTATLDNDGPVDEGSAATVTFTNQFDPNPADAAAGFRYAYDFDNDGTFEVGDGTYAGSVASASQVVPAAFFAEGPGSHTVRARIIDKDGGATDYTTLITIDNVAPQLANLVVVDDSIEEGQAASIQMNIVDPSASDVFSVEVDWSDGGSADTITGLGLMDANGNVGSTTYEWDAETRQLTVTHLYEDDPAGANDTRAVALVVRDDDLGASNPYHVDITVTNVPPTLVVAVNQTVSEGAVLDLSAVTGPPLGLFVDPGVLDTHTAVVNWGDGTGLQSATIFPAPGSGTIGGTHVYAENGVYTVTVRLADDDMSGNFAIGVAGIDFVQRTFQVTVDNVPPTLVVAVDQTVSEGAVLDLSAVTGPPLGLFVDPGVLDTHTAVVSWGDGGGFESATIFAAPGSGTIGGTHVYAENGVYTVTVRLADDDMSGNFATGVAGVDFVQRMFQVTVNNVPPTLVVAVDQTVSEGAMLDLSAVTGPPLGLFVDPGVLDTHTAVVSWGDGTTFESATIFAAPGSGAIGATHIYADNGTYAVTVRLADDDMSGNFATGVAGVDFVEKMFTVTVNNVVPALSVAPMAAAVEEGSEFTFNATFDDPGFDNPANPGGATSETFRYYVDWGDGRDLVSNAPVTNRTSGGPMVPTTGLFDASHIYADNGTYTVTVRLADDDMTGNFATGVAGVDFVEKTITVTVTNVAPTPEVIPTASSISEGSTVGFTATFSDPGFDNPTNPGGATAETFRYFVDWGDGRDPVPDSPVTNTTNGGPMVLTTGTFSGNHTYADDGVYTVTIRIADDDMSGNFATGIDSVDFVERTFTVTVTNLPPTISLPGTVTVKEGTAFTLTELNVKLEDIGFDNLDNPNSLPLPADPLRETFRAMDIDWGDGTEISPVAINNDPPDRVSGSPGVTTTALFTHAAHTYADDGIYTVRIRVADDNMLGDFSGEAGDENYVVLTFTITVENVPPDVTGPPGSFTVAESQDLLIPTLATFSDPGFDNLANPNGASTESFQYYVDWGDGRDQLSAVPVADLDGAPGTPSTGFFGGMHNYADNGVYVVTVRVADDDMGAFGSMEIFRTGSEENFDFVEIQFTVTVTNVAPAFTPQPDGENLAAPDLDQNGITTVFVAYNDPGYDNPLNTFASNGGETVETFNHVIQWGDGIVDAVHQYTTAGTFTVTVTVTGPNGTSQPIAFPGISSTNPVVNLVSSQQINDPAVVPQLYSFQVEWGDGHVETFTLMLRNPGGPAGFTGLTNLVTSARTSGSALTNTTGLAAIQHQYLGPPNPLNPTADIVITLSVYDDDGGFITDTIAVGNPGIQTTMVAIDTTPDVARLDLTTQPVTVGFVADQGGLAQLIQVPDVRGGGGDTAATTERYLELRVVYADGSESEGYRIKDDALADLRAFFKTLPDGRYRIYLIRTENPSDPRLVIEVDVRRGRVIDVTDESEGLRDRPPVEEQSPPAVPLEQNPLLEQGQRQGDKETGRQGDFVGTAGQADDRVSLSPQLPLCLSLAALAAAEPWSRRVDDALAGADDRAWRRLRWAGRRGRWGCVPKLATRSRLRTTLPVDYNSKT